MIINRTLIASIAITIFCINLSNANWPDCKHDPQRSGTTDQNLTLPAKQAWSYDSGFAPSPAWPAPAKHNYYHRALNLEPATTFDRVNHVVSDGKNVLFGSSTENCIYCLDIATGQMRWNATLTAAIRFAPTINGDKVYAGSDDGYIYCFDLDGNKIWSVKAHSDENDYYLPGNGKIMNVYPIRTGIIVQDGTIYCCAGIFPTQGCYLIALDASDGSNKWKQKLDISPQGYILATDKYIVIPSGRTEPHLYAVNDGKHLGNVPGPGGSSVVIYKDQISSGTGRYSGTIEIANTQRQLLARFDGMGMILKDNIAYLQSKDEVSALDRTGYIKLQSDINNCNNQKKLLNQRLKKEPDKKTEIEAEIKKISQQIAAASAQMPKCWKWRTAIARPFGMILARDQLIIGGDGNVIILDAANGKELQSFEVTGKAYSLAIAANTLLVSTDTGNVYAFNSKTGKTNHHQRQIETINRPWFAQMAKAIITQADTDKGYCLLPQDQQFELAAEIAKASDMQVITTNDIGVDAQNELYSEGLLGSKISLINNPDKLSDYIANVIIIKQKSLPVDPADTLKLLRPWGGTLFILHQNKDSQKETINNWVASIDNNFMVDNNITYKNIEMASNRFATVLTRGKLKGEGTWTSLHADPGNSACSGDTIVNGPMNVQWFGRPGPHDMPDRHHRNTAPLYRNGRMFIAGDNVLFGVDAYNGAILWKADLPESIRLGVFLDSGSMIVDNKHVRIVAKDQVYAFDVKTGKTDQQFDMPAIETPGKFHWAYINQVDNNIFGSATIAGSAYQHQSYDDDLLLWYHNMKEVTSKYVFAIDAQTGQKKWTWQKGIILNPTITLADGKMIFIETTAPKALVSETSRLASKDLFDGGQQFLTALDQNTGDIIYRRPIDTSNFKEPVTLNYNNGVLLLNGSQLINNKDVHYYCYAFNVTDGSDLWQIDHATGLNTDGGHGEYNRHPTIIDNIAYIWPYAYNIQTGKKVEGWKMDRRGHGCGGISASAAGLFWRGNNPWQYDLQANSPIRINTVNRPGCWINMIPAGGLMLMPEASSGCSCGYSIQCSMAYAPVKTNVIKD
ncbi:MAG: PQQ-binding-like beta-propeller repeat protein [Phycisphaerae bacterium]|nr:PQQ-binding-like beta-propeller repeat protein [Phycisphaerae bacterium]